MDSEPKRPSRSRRKESVIKVTSQSIAEQTEAFLKAGGTIKKIKIGVYGQKTYSATGVRRKS